MCHSSRYQQTLIYDNLILICYDMCVWTIEMMLENCLHQPIKFSCNMLFELVKNGRSDGFGVDPTDKLSISGPESSPSQHDSESNSWNNASNSRSPRNRPGPRVTPPSSSSGTLKRFSNAMIFCLKFRC